MTEVQLPKPTWKSRIWYFIIPYFGIPLSQTDGDDSPRLFKALTAYNIGLTVAAIVIGLVTK
jgi:hypothetical protein